MKSQISLKYLGTNFWKQKEKLTKTWGHVTCFTLLSIAVNNVNIQRTEDNDPNSSTCNYTLLWFISIHVYIFYEQKRKCLYYISKNCSYIRMQRNHNKISKIRKKINFYMCNKEVNISYSFFEILKHFSKPLFSQKKKKEFIIH